MPYSEAEIQARDRAIKAHALAKQAIAAAAALRAALPAQARELARPASSARVKQTQVAKTTCVRGWNCVRAAAEPFEFLCAVFKHCGYDMYTAVNLKDANIKGAEQMIGSLLPFTSSKLDINSFCTLWEEKTKDHLFIIDAGSGEGRWLILVALLKWARAARIHGKDVGGRPKRGRRVSGRAVPAPGEHVPHASVCAHGHPNRPNANFCQTHGCSQPVGLPQAEAELALHSTEGCSYLGIEYVAARVDLANKLADTVRCTLGLTQSQFDVRFECQDLRSYVVQSQCTESTLLFSNCLRFSDARKRQGDPDYLCGMLLRRLLEDWQVKLSGLTVISTDEFPGMDGVSTGDAARFTLNIDDTRTCPPTSHNMSATWLWHPGSARNGLWTGTLYTYNSTVKAQYRSDATVSTDVVGDTRSIVDSTVDEGGESDAEPAVAVGVSSPSRGARQPPESAWRREWAGPFPPPQWATRTGPCTMGKAAVFAPPPDVQVVYGDGNCFFRALALYSNAALRLAKRSAKGVAEEPEFRTIEDTEAHAMRLDIAQYIVEHPDRDAVSWPDVRGHRSYDV
jgi:hypothetical protein